MTRPHNSVALRQDPASDKYLQDMFTFVLFYLNLDTKNSSLKRTIKDIRAFKPQTNVRKAMLQYCQLSGKLIHQDFA